MNAIIENARPERRWRSPGTCRLYNIAGYSRAAGQSSCRAREGLGEQLGTGSRFDEGISG